MNAALRSRPVARGELAYTLVELLVGMFLLAIVVGMVTTIIISAFNGGADSRGGAASQAAIAKAQGALTDDVQRAVTSDRHDVKLRDPQLLMDAVQTNVNPVKSDDPAAFGQVISFDDVVAATPTTLSLRMKLSSTTSTTDDCVTWNVTSAGAYAVTRSVNTSCGSTTGTQTLLKAPEGATGMSTQPFQYQLVCNRSTCPGAPAPSGGAGVCTPWIATSVPAAQLRWVVGVRASFTNMQGGKNPQDGAGGAFTSIRSRDTDSYRRALGC